MGMLLDVQDAPDESGPQHSTTTPMKGEDTSHLLIAGQFNIVDANDAEQNKLKEIYDHAKSLSKTGDPQDIIWQVINLRGVMGAPRLGESELDRMYRYAKLRRHQRIIEDELKQLGTRSHL